MPTVRYERFSSSRLCFARPDRLGVGCLTTVFGLCRCCCLTLRSGGPGRRRLGVGGRGPGGPSLALLSFLGRNRLVDAGDPGEQRPTTGG